MSKINAPFVIEHIAAFLTFPSQLLQLRLVSKRFNKAAKKALIAQLKAIEVQNATLKFRITQFEEDPEIQSEMHQYQEASLTVKNFKINKEKMTEVRSFHNPPAIVYPAMNLLAILIKGEPFQKWNKLKPFICNLHLLKEAKEAKLTPHKVALIEQSIKDWILTKLSISPVSKTLGQIDVLTFINAKLKQHELENNELKEYSQMKEKLKRGLKILELGFKALEELWK